MYITFHELSLMLNITLVFKTGLTTPKRLLITDTAVQFNFVTIDNLHWYFNEVTFHIYRQLHMLLATIKLNLQVDPSDVINAFHV